MNTPLVPFPPDKRRCRPAVPGACVCRLRCARGMAELVPGGLEPHDFSAEPRGGTLSCEGYVDMARVLKASKKLRAVRRG